MATAGEDIEADIDVQDDGKNANQNTIHQEVVIDIHVRHLKL